jgi:hypothetical protein
MKTLQNKSWTNDSVTSARKYLARIMTHQLSRKLKHDAFDIVYEGNLDNADPSSEEADVAVYSTRDSFKPVVAIEIGDTSDLFELMLTAKLLLEQYLLKEFFIFDYKNLIWYRLTPNTDSFTETSFSVLFGIHLDRLLVAPADDRKNTQEERQEKDMQVYSKRFIHMFGNPK